VHEDAEVQVPNRSWPVGALGFGVGAIDHPDSAAPAAGDAGTLPDGNWPPGAAGLAWAGAAIAARASVASAAAAIVIARIGCSLSQVNAFADRR
jgi:hypothetical protein